MEQNSHDTPETDLSFKSLSIKRRLQLFTIGISSFAILLIAIPFLISTQLYDKQNMVEAVTTTATLLGKQSLEAIEFDDIVSAEETFQTITSLPHINLVCLYTADHRVFAHFNPNNKTLHAIDVEQTPCPLFEKEQNIFTNHFLFIFQDIKQGEQIPGHILVQASLQPLKDKITQQRAYGIGLAIVVILIAFFLSTRFVQAIIAPIDNLANVTTRYKEDKDLSIRATKYSDDELGHLVDSFNQMMQDIEDRDKKLFIAMERSGEANRLKGEFLATMSHEIRTPINGIIGTTELMLDTELSGTQKNYASTIMNSSETLLEIINDILDFSKIESGKMELEQTPFNFYRLIKDTSQLLSVTAQDKMIELIVQYPDQMPSHFIGDPVRLQQIISNLLSNAIKFTENGYVLLNVKSTNYDTSQKQHSLSISVTDTGIGIPDDQQALIFEKFSQADSSTTRQFGGTGLGLSICQKLTSMMGGTITLQSEENKGSTFTVSIALKPETQQTPPLFPLKNMPPSPKALIVDTLQKRYDLLSRFLTYFNVPYDVVHNGRDALTQLQTGIDTGKPYHLCFIENSNAQTHQQNTINIIRSNKQFAQTKLISLGNVSPEQADLFDSGVKSPFFKEDIHQLLSTLWQTKNHSLSYISSAKNHRHYSSQDTSYSILLVEDNLTNRMVAEKMLKDIGHTVTIASHGQDALSLIEKNNPYDLIFMDCQMPVMDGFETTGILKQKMNNGEINNIPIIALTANAMKGDKEKCFNAGMDDYLTKPVRKNDFITTIKKWLG
jgi:two-component system sensor histidine kinase/response regulator